MFAAILSTALSVAVAAPAAAILPTPVLFVQNSGTSNANTINASTTHAANRMIGGIISYVRWPNAVPMEQRQLCVLGNPQLASTIYPSIPGHQNITVTHRQVRDILRANDAPDCDALYMGQMTVMERQRIIAWVRGKPVLTISDADPTCAYGAMFCLVRRGQSMSFSMNMDAIGRGTLRVDPRVLRFGREAS